MQFYATSPARNKARNIKTEKKNTPKGVVSVILTSNASLSLVALM